MRMEHDHIASLIKRYPIILSVVFALVACAGIFRLARVSVPVGIVVVVLAAAVLVGRLVLAWVGGKERAPRRSGPHAS